MGSVYPRRPRYPRNKEVSKITVQLGASGDVLAILPLLHQDFLKTGERQKLMVAKDYAPILEGCSYIDPIIFDGHYSELKKALEYAKELSKDVQSSQVVGPIEVIASQIYGKDYDQTKMCDSFQKESWRVLGRLDEWRLQYPLFFDKRDKRRERKFIPKHMDSKPWILVSTEGKSSPFKFKELLWKTLETLKDEFYLIDLDELKADRFFDLLGLMGNYNTYCIVAIDSGILHLAHAVQKPVVALIADSPTMWHGSAYRPNHIRNVRYSVFPEMACSILDRIRAIGSPGCRFQDPQGNTGKRIVHVYCDNGFLNSDERRRHFVAEESWDHEYRNGCWEKVGISDGSLYRSKDGTVYIKDLLRLASLHAQDDDILLLTNSDIGFSRGITEAIFALVNEHGAVSMSRRDFNGPLDAPLTNDEIAKGRDYPGKDGFAFTKKWWRENNSEFPDMLIGREGWDKIMHTLITMKGGVLAKDLIYHEEHASKWIVARDKGEGNIHNRKLAAAWLRRHNLPLDELSAFDESHPKPEKPEKKPKIRPLMSSIF